MEAKTLAAQINSYTTFNPLKILSQNSDSIVVNLAPYHNIHIWVPFQLLYCMHGLKMQKTTDLHRCKLFHKYTILT